MSLQANTIHGMCTVSIFNIFSAICYLFVIRKLAQLNRDQKWVELEENVTENQWCIGRRKNMSVL